METLAPIPETRSRDVADPSPDHGRPRGRRRRGADGQTGRERNVVLLAPILLLGAWAALAPFLPLAGDAVATESSGDEDVVLPGILPAPSVGSTILSLPWGEGPAEVGLAALEGCERRGPEAFAVAEDGRMVVLDSVNGRLLLFDSSGAALDPIPLDLGSPRFLAVTAESIHVLDADADRAVRSYAWDGRLDATLALQETDDPVTALFVDNDGRPLVELAHEGTVMVGESERGHAPSSARPERGRPLDRGSGRRLGASLTSDGRPRVERRDEQRGLEKSWRIDPGARGRVDHLVSLDADPAGRVVLGMKLNDPPGHADGDPGSLLLARLGDESLPLLLTESTFAHLGQPYIVGGDGLVYAPVADAQGYRIVAHAFPEVTP